MAIPVVSPVMKKVFGTRNERMVKRYMRVVEQVSRHEEQVSALTDEELRAKTDEFRKRITGGERADDMIPEVFAVAREAMDRNVGIRNIFDPEQNFDPSRLPDDARALYDQTKQMIDSMEPAPPEGMLLGSDGPTPPWKIVDIPLRLHQAVRELYPKSKPPYRARPFDVQIIGAVVLYEGRIAEMKTGEGKTIVAPLACYLAALQDMQVHVVTVNDYLVQRDRDWTFPFFHALGLTTGAIHPQHMQPPQEKQTAYDCDVVYGTTSEFGFDYLRDNMKLRVADQVQKRRDFAIVDEVDSTLIDEARTPLIISGMAHDHQPRYELADRLARFLVEKQEPWNKADERVQSCLMKISSLEGDIRNARDKSKVPELKKQLEQEKATLPELEAERDKYDQYYEVELDKKKANLTHEGIALAQKEAGVGSFYVGDNIDIPHLLENAIRAHSVYQRDRDYVVAPDDEGKPSVVIVDQNTGRKMVGRQWSDGLHQAVEAKEGVPIKQETQTMATITIQNFFKLYDRLAGMTGTADTEATEFYEIYKLDVIVIPTNVPVIREDRNDLVYIAAKDKWESIVDEIKRHHDLGQPVLVGTTSVERSEMLSQMLTKKYQIKHEVLNAKQHEREAEIIAHAGELGAVMIATNMAGRGTDIKLGQFTTAELIEHWKRRNLAGRDGSPDQPEEEITAGVYRHIAPRELGLNKKDVEAMSDDEIRMALLRKWAVEYAWMSEGKADSLSEAKLKEALDQTGICMLHRLRAFEDVNDLGGLHVVGTERHQSRRIDNQLRGRSGRQGDNGSSRFFLSLEDDLMKMFAGNTTLNVLSKLGMKEGDAIEHPMLNRAVGRAQRKGEERDFLIRKNILEYDEVMDHQRHEFYGQRQEVLEGKGITEKIFNYLDEAAEDAVYRYLDRNYVAHCVAEWVRENLNVSIDPDRIRNKQDDREDLHKLIEVDAKEEAASIIEVTMGEYLPAESDPAEWDVKALVDWGAANFEADLKIAEVREMTPAEVRQRLVEAAERKIDKADLSPTDQFLVPNYGEKELAKWAKNKFDIDLDIEDFANVEELEDAVERLQKAVRDAYAEREITYPIDFAIDMTSANMQQDPRGALEHFCRWVKARYDLEWSPNALPSTNPEELKQVLYDEARKWDDSRIEERAQQVLAGGTSVEHIENWLRDNAGAQLTDDERTRAEDDPKSVLEDKFRQIQRAELTQFERWVLLQILDQAWKDHLHAMDQVRESIGFRSFSQLDPRIEFKREGARLFEEMHRTVRDKLTDLVFKAKLTPQVAQRRPEQQQQQQQQQQAPGDGDGSGGDGQQQRRPVQPAQHATAAAAAAASGAVGTAQQQRDIEQAERAGAPAGGAKRQPVRAAPSVGRNEPCPCGSGKKYKQCCGKRT